MMKSKDYHILNTVCLFYCFFTSLLVLYILVINGSEPRLYFKSDYIMDDDVTLIGAFHSPNNQVHVSLKSSNVLRTIYHEYSHYIYHRYRLEDDWSCDEEVYINEIDYEGRICGERFAVAMANYLMLVDKDFNYHVTWSYSRETYDFCEEVYNKYIP